VSFGNAFLIGISQAIAILPGVSRSGATISTSVLLGIDRGRAAKFSFLMVVPLILGKIAKDLLEYLTADATVVAENAALMDSTTLPLVVGFAAAFITGVFACRWMIDLVRNSQLKYFSYYCFAVGLAAIIIGYMA